MLVLQFKGLVNKYRGVGGWVGANGGGWVTRFSALTKGWVIKF